MKTFFPIETLDELSFGQLTGEEDDLLKKSFTFTKSIKRLKKYRFNYILSPKGAGKSALFKIISEEYEVVNKFLDLELYSIIQINKAFGFESEYLNPKNFKKSNKYYHYSFSWGLYLMIKLIEDILNFHQNKRGFSQFKSEVRQYIELKEEFHLYSIQYTGFSK